VIKRALERSVCQMEEREGDLAENLESKLELVAGKYTGGVS